jgi:hypothetical protein
MQKIKPIVKFKLWFLVLSRKTELFFKSQIYSHNNLMILINKQVAEFTCNVRLIK